MSTVTRTEPQNQSAEESVIGAMLLSRDAIGPAVEILRREHFYNSGNGDVFDAISTLYNEGAEIDVVTVENQLIKAGALERVGGSDRLLSLAANTPTTAHVGRYARMVEEQALLRQLVSVGAEIQQMGLSNPPDAAKVIDEAESKVFAIAEQRIADTTASFQDLVPIFLDRLEVLYNQPDHVTGLRTGYVQIDDLLAGLQPSNLIVVGARPSMGKTALALGMAANVAVHERKPVLFFSLEMEHLELVSRLVAAQTRLSAQNLATANIREGDWTPVTNALTTLSEAPMWIDDNPNLTIAEVRAKARRLQARAGELGLVVVDYLQLMSGRTGAESRQVEVAEMSRGLKVLARELKAPVVALSQLSRNLESRADKRPMLSDLRESGSIEQDADVVMFLYRDEVYNPDSPDQGLAEVHVAKHRNGPTGHARLVWLSEATAFGNATPAGVPDGPWESGG